MTDALLQGFDNLDPTIRALVAPLLGEIGFQIAIIFRVPLLER